MDPEQLQILEKRLRSMNARAKINPTQKSSIDVYKVLGINAFDIEKKLEIDPGFLKEVDHEHDDSVGSIVLREERPLDF